jgi:hypothetical protein
MLSLGMPYAAIGLDRFLSGPLAQGWLLAQTRVFYQWSRAEQLDQWWHWPLIALVIAAVVAYVVWWYRRDAQEQLRPVGWALLALRLAAIAGLVLYFFQLDKRSEQRVTRNSRVAILVDTSLSMTLPGTPSASGLASNITRAEEAARLVADSPALAELAAQHDVTVYRFDQVARPQQVASLLRTGGLGAGDPEALPGATFAGTETSGLAAGQASTRFELAMLQRSRWLMVAACILGALAIAMTAISLGSQVTGARQWVGGAWALLSGSLLTLLALLVLAAAILPASNYPLYALLMEPERALREYRADSDDFDGDGVGGQLPRVTAASLGGPTETPATANAGEAGHANSGNAENDASSSGTRLPTDWREALAPSGIETRMGDAIKSILERERGSPLAAIVVVTDGRNNAGLDPRSLVLAAQNARVPLMMIGVGSDVSPPNVKLVEVDAPKRVYPGDKFVLSALVQGTGFDGQSVTVQVSSGPRQSDPATYQIEAEQQLPLGSDDQLVSAKFELDPKAVGEWGYLVKVLPLSGDADETDNQGQATVAVIERKNRVLIFAGGPTREYQFARNLLYRDRDVESHVLLQTGRTGISQEAQEILEEFPADRTALAQYDAVLAFDADWTKLSDSQVQALEQWVAEQAGGLMIVAGSVETPKWLARSAGGERANILRALSPVRLEQRGSRLLAAGRTEAEKAWPLKLTTDGLQADFLWLSDDPQTSNRLWETFEGVYGFHAAYELKPGAKALALFSDPTTAVDGNLPIYLASQFYGAGRVVYQGGGEMWRIRELGDLYFDRYYTKLVRWISQGRLMLDSDRGVLLVDREQALLGDQVAVRAVLKDQRFQPLIQSEVVARLLDPRKRNMPLVLRPLPDGSQPGVYTGQFPAQAAGEYTIQLQLGGLASEEVLSASVKARVPAVEMQRAERNDELLAALAIQTGGRYMPGVAAALAPADSGQQTALAAAIVPQDQTTYLPGVPDRRFQLRWLGWLMGLIAGCLSLEWLARRLHRLA